VISFYKRQSNSKKNVRYQILNTFVLAEDTQEEIVAAHIWKESTRGFGLEEFDLESKDVNSARNGLFLTKGIEDAFDKQQVCFLFNLLKQKLVLWVAGTALMDKKIEGASPETLFSEIHKKTCFALQIVFLTGVSCRGTQG
jgi:hypothetical protein